MKNRPCLAPLSWLYGSVVGLRNKLFDWGIIPSESFALPVIAVGNLTVGGTGKTPFTEYLIRQLKDDFHVSFLSRGYKRATRGYRLADASSTAHTIGDEPFQVWQKFPDIHVAVDANRRRGIHRLCEDTATADTDVVLLDDAFQHRHVTPGLSILLMDYHRLPDEDKLLPCGLLREPFSSKRRADVVVVTKCPSSLTPIDFRILQRRIALRPYQRLFFCSISYGALLPTNRKLSTLTADTAVLLLTGIANPTPLIDELKRRTPHVQALTFPDHHAFSTADISRITDAWAAIEADDRLIITTEKDAARLAGDSRIDALRPHLHILPIQTTFLRDQEKTFNHYIRNYVRKNSRNSSVRPRTHA